VPPIRLRKRNAGAGVVVATPTGRTILNRVVRRLAQQWQACKPEDSERNAIVEAISACNICYSKLHPDWRDKF